MEMRVFGFKNWNRLPSNRPGSSYLHRQLCPALILPPGPGFFCGSSPDPELSLFGWFLLLVCMLARDGHSIFDIFSLRTPNPVLCIPAAYFPAAVFSSAASRTGARFGHQYVRDRSRPRSAFPFQRVPAALLRARSRSREQMEPTVPSWKNSGFSFTLSSSG